MSSNRYQASLRSSTDADLVNALRACLGLDPLRQDGRVEAERDRPKFSRGRARTSSGPRGWNWRDDPRARSKRP